MSFSLHCTLAEEHLCKHSGSINSSISNACNNCVVVTSYMAMKFAVVLFTPHGKSEIVNVKTVLGILQARSSHCCSMRSGTREAHF